MIKQKKKFMQCKSKSYYNMQTCTSVLFPNSRIVHWGNSKFHFFFNLQFAGLYDKAKSLCITGPKWWRSLSTWESEHLDPFSVCAILLTISTISLVTLKTKCLWFLFFLIENWTSNIDILWIQFFHILEMKVMAIWIICLLIIVLYITILKIYFIKTLTCKTH